MKAFTKSVRFLPGIVIGIVLSSVISLMDYNLKFDGLCFDCDNDFGFPLKVYQSGSLIQAAKILWIGVFGNILIFGLASVCLGVVIHIYGKRKY